MNKTTYKILFILLLATYIFLAFVLPTDPAVLAKYSINSTQAKLLNLTVVIPISIIYMIALYGYIQFRKYSEAIIKTKEGSYYKTIAAGLMIQALALPISALSNSMVSYIKFNNESLYSTAYIAQNYLELLLAAVAILFVAKGVDGLYKTLPNQRPFVWSHRSIFAIVVVVSIYMWLVTSQQTVVTDQNIFQFPEWARVITLAIPYLYIWIIGAKTTYLLYKYKQGVKGSVYKNSYDSLYKGFGIIIIVSILIRIISTLSEQLNRLNLSPLLLIIYLLLLLYALGYGLLARGSLLLKKIEEV